MIHKRWTEIITRRNQAGQPIEYPGYIINIVPHCNPAKKNRKGKTPDGFKDTKFLAWSRCKVCRGETAYVCSHCVDYLCHDKFGRLCLDTKYEENH